MRWSKTALHIEIDFDLIGAWDRRATSPKSQKKKKLFKYVSNASIIFAARYEFCGQNGESTVTRHNNRTVLRIDLCAAIATILKLQFCV